MTDQSPRDQGIDHIEAVLHTTQAGAILPAARAVFFSLMMGFSAAVVCLVIDPIREYWWRAGLFALAVSMVGSWWIDERRRGRLFDALERRLNFDMDGDGDIGGVPVPEENVKVQIERVNENGIVEGTFSRLPVKRDQLRAFAIRVLEQDETTALRTWVGPLNVFTREEYDAFVSWLDNHDGVNWKSEHDHRVGWTLSDEGKQILRKFLS